MLSFGLFILVTAVLIVRPMDLIPGMEGSQLYEMVVLAALVASIPRIAAQLMPQALKARPVTTFLLGLLMAVVASHAAHFRTWEAQESGLIYLKIVLFYLLLVSTVRSMSQLQKFLRCVVVFIAIHAGFALMQYSGMIDVATLRTHREGQMDREDGLVEELPRLRGSGILNDPNEFCVLLSVGVVLSLYLMGDRRSGAGRWMWGLPLVVLATAVPLTHSRGGALALLAGLGVLAVDRYGARRGMLVLALGMPLMLAALAGRSTTVDLTDPDDTSQHRVHLWSDALMEFRGSPLFGIGQGKLPELIGLVAHNSYIEAYTELGVVGGTCFVAAVTYPIWALWRLRRRLDPRRQPTLSRLRAYLLAAIVVHAVGMLSLSRVYTQTTYLMVGMGTVFLARAAEVVPGAMPPLSPRLAIRVTLVSGAFLIALQIVTTVLIRRS